MMIPTSRGAFPHIGDLYEVPMVIPTTPGKDNVFHGAWDRTEKPMAKADLEMTVTVDDHTETWRNEIKRLTDERNAARCDASQQKEARQVEFDRIKQDHAKHIDRPRSDTGDDANHVATQAACDVLRNQEGQFDILCKQRDEAVVERDVAVRRYEKRIERHNTLAKAFKTYRESLKFQVNELAASLEKLRHEMVRFQPEADIAWQEEEARDPGGETRKAREADPSEIIELRTVALHPDTTDGLRMKVITWLAELAWSRQSGEPNSEPHMAMRKAREDGLAEIERLRRIIVNKPSATAQEKFDAIGRLLTLALDGITKTDEHNPNPSLPDFPPGHRGGPFRIP